jgi:peroxiredoxin
MDALPSNMAFAKQIGVTGFPLLSDWDRSVTKDYGLYDEQRHTGRRATFVVDKEGKIQQVVVDRVALDPTTTLESCSLLERKLVVAPPKP